MSTKEFTDISSSSQTEKTAEQYVAEAVINDIELISTIKKPNHAILCAALYKTIHNALTEVQSIAFLAKNKNDFYAMNIKYIMILSMYQDVLKDKISKYTTKQMANTTLIDQQSQLFVIMLSKLFQLIKRADIYFEDEKQYSQFKHLLPVQMYIDNVVIPNEQEKSTKSVVKNK